MQARYHVAVRRPDDDAVLVLADGAMPGFAVTDAPWWQVVTPVVEAMRRDHGLDVVVLRAAWLDDPDATGRVDRLYEAVWRGGPIPAGSRWVPLASLERRPSPLGRAIDGGALAPCVGDRQPWYRPDWFADMAAWIEEALGGAGLRRHGPLRQVRSWGRSALLAIETDRGRVWAKQVPSVFAHEVALTELLSDIDPGIVPPVIAADVRAGRLLLEHVEGSLLSDDLAMSAAWTATLERLAEIQRVLGAELGAVRVAGVPTLGPAALADDLGRLLADPASTLVGRPGGLGPATIERLAGARDDLAAACLALAASPVAASVDHGDLAASQVIIGEMGPVILDWSDATLTHPFLAAASFLMDPERVPANAGPELRAAYLTGWPVAADAAARDLDLAMVVQPLHLARHYADRILPALEQPWEMARMVPWALGTLRPRLAGLPRILPG